jgi:hypothetical protein
MEELENSMGFTMKEKTWTLDEYIRLTGYHRKYALTILKRWRKTTLVTTDGKPVKLKAGTGKRRKGGGRKPLPQTDRK